MDILSIDDLYFQTTDSQEEVTLKLATAGLAMKIKSTSKVITLKKEEIREIELFRSTHKFNMRIHANRILNINNIPEHKIEQIKDFCSSSYNINVYAKELDIESGNTGVLGLTGDFLEFKSGTSRKLIFDILLKDIESVHEMKNELTLNFKEKNGCVAEIRFNDTKGLANEIKERTSTGKMTELVTFETLQSIVPRGKNDYIFYNDRFKMVGSTYEHKILYSSVKQIFYLQKDNKEHYLAVNIDPPIRQGQTRYGFIVMVFTPDLEEEFELNLGENDREKFPGLQAKYSGEIGSSFLSVLQNVTGCGVTKAGAFVTLTGGKSLRCSLKAFDGHLYPLERSLVFMPKAIFMPLKDVQSVEFSRINLSTFAAKTFDMAVTTVDRVHYFNSLPKEDFGQLEQYFSEKNIKVTSEVMADEIRSSDKEEEEEEDDDDGIDTDSE